MKILRDLPDTLQGAVVIATTEQNLRNRVQLSHSNTTQKEIPMETIQEVRSLGIEIGLTKLIVQKVHSPKDQ